MNQKVENLKGKLIVSCQALSNEPLHSSFIMGRMALAAKQGGASGIRANTKEDIKEIQSQVDLPIIGIVKRDYDDSDIYITPTMKEIEELMEVKPEIIAMDATISKRIGGSNGGSGYNIIINGGSVTASSESGAGIGGGEGGSGEKITINGSSVTASSDNGAGIGGGKGGSGNKITINGGSVKATRLDYKPQNSSEQNVYRRPAR